MSKHATSGHAQQPPFNVSEPFFLIFFCVLFFPNGLGSPLRRGSLYGVGKGADAVCILRPPPWLAAAKSATLSRLNYVMVYWGAVGLTPSGVRGRGPGGLG